MKSICLIRPPKVTPKGFFTSGGAIPPIGIAYLVSSLELSSFDVCVIDAVGEDIKNYYFLPGFKKERIQGMFLEKIISKIPPEPLFIGISCMFSYEWFLYEELINTIKKIYPKTPIVLGGEHATADALNIISSCLAVDICVSGEGEQTIVELAVSINNGIDLCKIDGITYRLNNKAVKTPPRKRIKDINLIPLPAWDKIPIHNYLEMGYGMATINRRTMPIIASRGCPYTCTFCTSPQMWGTELYLRSPQSVIDEIRMYKDKYNIEHVDFLDIVGMLNKEWVKELLGLFIKEKFELTWLLSSGTRSEILDEEILQLFKDSNVLRILFSPESGSKITLKRIQKKVNLDKMTISMKKAHELEISMRAPLIYGFPGQTFKEALESLLYGFNLSFIGVDDVVAHAFSAHPGTELHRELVSQGSIDLNKLISNKNYSAFLRNEFSNKISGLHSWSIYIPNWTLPLFQFGGMGISYLILFVFHPKKLFQSLNRIFIKKVPLTLLDHVIYSIWFTKNPLSFVKRKR